MRVLLIIVFSCITQISFSQKKELHIEYDFYHKDYYPENRTINLLANRFESLSTIERTIIYTKDEESLPEPLSTYIRFYRKKDTFTYKEEIDNDNYFFIKESNNQKFKWEITGNSKKILEYNCQEAIATYEGREYVAYFTTEIAFKAAPWKFYGLPGVTLAIETVDKRIKIEAVTLAVKEISGDLINPFADVTDFITWDEFKVIYKKDWEDFKNKFFSQKSSLGSRNSSLGRPRISPGLRMEIIVEGNY